MSEKTSVKSELVPLRSKRCSSQVWEYHPWSENIPFKSSKILPSLGILHQVHEAPQVFEYYVTTKHNFQYVGILLQLQESFPECRNASLSPRFPFLNLIYFLNQENAKSKNIAQVWESMRKGLAYSLSLRIFPQGPRLFSSSPGYVPLESENISFYFTKVCVSCKIFCQVQGYSLKFTSPLSLSI